MTDYTERAIKAEITRLRNIAKTKPMSLSQKLEVLAKAKAAEARLRDYQLSKV